MEVLATLGLLAGPVPGLVEVAEVGHSLVHVVQPRSYGLKHVVLPLLSLDLVPVLVGVAEVGHGLVPIVQPRSHGLEHIVLLLLSLDLGLAMEVLATLGLLAGPVTGLV